MKIPKLKKLEDLKELDIKSPLKMTSKPHGELGFLDARKDKVVWIATYENLQNANNSSYKDVYSVSDINGKVKTFPARFVRENLRNGNIIYGIPKEYLEFVTGPCFKEDDTKDVS